MTAVDLTEATRCPICLQSNRCAMEIAKTTGLPQGDCWCTQSVFTQSLLNRIPPALRGVACVCQACATADHSSETNQPEEKHANVSH